jgi:hypothetical protein
MSTPTIHFCDQITSAANALATAALAPRDPVLVFSTADLSQVGAHEGDEVPTPRPGRIAVCPPRHYGDADDLADLCAHRLRKALLRAGHAGSFAAIGVLDLVEAVAALVAAARRRECPSDFIALRAGDLREVDLTDLTATDPRAAGGVLWISLAGLPATWPAAVAAARARIEAALRPGPTDLSAIPVAAPPAPRLAA